MGEGGGIDQQFVIVASKGGEDVAADKVLKASSKRGHFELSDTD